MALACCLGVALGSLFWRPVASRPLIDPLSPGKFHNTIGRPQDAGSTRDATQMQSQPQTSVGSIRVTVRYPDGSSVVPDRLILYNSSWQSLQSVTPSSSSYTFSNLNPGTYHVEAYKDDMFIGSAENISVSAGTTTDRTITTVYKGSIDVTVRCSDGSTALQGAMVKLYTHENRYLTEGTSNSSGKVFFSNRWPTTKAGEYYYVKVYFNSNLVGTSSNFQVRPNQTTYVTVNTSQSCVTFNLVPIYPGSETISSSVMQGGIVYRHFRLLDPEGDPIPNATVVFSVGDPAITDASGYFTFTVAADALGGPGLTYTVNVQSVTISGQTNSTNGQPGAHIKVGGEMTWQRKWDKLSGFQLRVPKGVSIPDGVSAR
jgi:hypothetical protein